MSERKAEGNANPRVLSLFSGCGGLDLGFHKAGYDIVFANDIEASVQDTYEYNLGKIEIGDIANYEKQDLPCCDVVLAGVPCQPFSNAGKRGSTRDSRGVLFEHVIEIVDIKKPKIVLFENVRGFTSAKDEEGVTMPERIKMELKKHGYDLHYQLLNSADYGVPQNRFRVVLVGVRDDVGSTFEFPDKIKRTPKLELGSVLSKPYPKGEVQEVWSLSPQQIRLSKFIPEGGSWKDIPDAELPERLTKIRKQMKKYRSPNFYRRFARDEIMGTVTAASTPENSGILHPLEHRRYSVREIARFQSFPDSFKFIGPSVAKKYKMIGNAVPVNLAFHLAKKIKHDFF